MNKALLLVVGLILSTCVSTPKPCQPAPSSPDVVYVVGQGWHAEIGVPVGELNGPLRMFSQGFSGAKVIMFGYGKRTFMTAPARDISDYILGPVPGPAVIHVVGLRVGPVEAYPGEDVVVLKVPKGGAQALSGYLWGDLSKDKGGKPQLVSESHDPAGLFYSAVSEYNLTHTCNTWVAAALQATGIHISSDAVIFSGQIMARAREAVENQCVINE